MPAKFKKDILCILILAVIFVPLYTLFLYEIPYQVNTDEVTLMIVEKISSQKNPLELFGLASHYFHHPEFIYIIFGWLGNLIGGVNLYNIRLIHAFFGLLIIALSYIFFRLSLRSMAAFCASFILGSNHALIAISRMAMRENSVLLIEVVSLGVLFYGLLKRKLVIIFLGGLITGLSFYVYFPSRVTIGIWLVFLLSWLFFNRNVKRFLLYGLVSVMGFLIIILPLIIKTFNLPFDRTHYQREQLLIFPEGRQTQKDWIGAKSIQEGIVINIRNNLTVFNNKISDYSYIYPNPGHGFFDPFSGILIWIGILMAIFSLFRNRIKNASDYFNLAGIFLLLFVFGFITNKAPNYTRLLVILPFAAYFVVRGVTGIIELLKAKNIIKYSILIGILSLIIIWNLTIFYDFVQKGFTEGNDVGGTARYVEARNNIHSYKFYLAADNNYPYYGWGGEGQWKDWIGFFAKDDQIVEILPTSGFINTLSERPFTIFMSRPLWITSKSEFVLKYTKLQIHNIKPDGSLVAIEVK